MSYNLKLPHYHHGFAYSASTECVSPAQLFASDLTECRSTTEVVALLLVLPLVLTLVLACCMVLWCYSNQTLTTNISLAIGIWYAQMV